MGATATPSPSPWPTPPAPRPWATPGASAEGRVPDPWATAAASNGPTSHDASGHVAQSADSFQAEAMQ
eukprot:6735377-Pyramimonas_sp.AAC.1